MTLDAAIDLHLGPFHLDVALAAEPGSVVAVLGPNGAGKTTIMRVLAGTLAVERGHVRLDGRDLDDPATATFVPPERRRVGLVHQDHLLFPHLSALDNVAFGLRSQGATKQAARATAARWLDRAGLADHAADRPATLSGGQAQRVALARALAVDPDLLLLDEPLAALDPTTRAATRRSLKEHLTDQRGPTVVVTHDLLDALALADRIVVVEAGRVTQAAPVAEVVERPRTAYVADLLGTNLLRGEAIGGRVRVGEIEVPVGGRIRGPAFLAVSPGAIRVVAGDPSAPPDQLGAPASRWPSTVREVELLGDRVRAHLDGPLPLMAEVPAAEAAQIGLVAGTAVWAILPAAAVRVYPA